MKFYTYIKETIKNNLSHQSFQKKFKAVEFRSNDFKMFIGTLWYENVDDYDFLRLENVLPLKIHLD
jgi:ubiquinone/menaquinone biosynthesis C-methylase UbiE